MFNKAILMGRLTKDPELRATPNGVSVCTFSIAVDRQYSSKGEERKTDFFNIVAWRQTAEFISKYFTKGRCVLVEGELQNRSYTDKDGITRYVTEVIASQVSFTGEKKTEGASAQQAPSPAEPVGITQGDKAQYEESPDDDYPF